MIHATYAALSERPKTFNGIRVAIPTRVNLFGVIDPRVLVSRFAQKVIRRPFVRVDRSRWQHGRERRLQ